MYKPLVILTALALPIVPAKAQDYAAIAQFAQSICGDIPEGSLTRTNIQGKVQANANLLAKVVGGSGDITASRADEVYKGIPFDKLPDKIPTVSMCKSELVKILLQKKQVSNTCRMADFGQEGWNRTENYENSSGRMGGGHDQNWWCNEVAASFIQTRSIGPNNHWERLASSEESHKDTWGHVDYKYHCTIRVDWDPRYNEKQDPRCGSHQE